MILSKYKTFSRLVHETILDDELDINSLSRQLSLGHCATLETPCKHVEGDCPAGGINAAYSVSPPASATSLWRQAASQWQTACSLVQTARSTPCIRNDSAHEVWDDRDSVALASCGQPASSGPRSMIGKYQQNTGSHMAWSRSPATIGSQCGSDSENAINLENVQARLDESHCEAIGSAKASGACHQASCPSSPISPCMQAAKPAKIT
jgi:hypothetical protein